MSEAKVDLQLLESFALVAEEGSFSKAAQRLGVGKATVSRDMAQLESLLGVELIHRTTHKVALSTAGTELLERIRGPLTALRQALGEMPERDEEPAGLLRITAPHDYGVVVLPALLAAFARRHPSISFEVKLSSSAEDLVKGGYDLAIRVTAGGLRDSSLMARRVLRTSGSFYASPAYIARRGRPRDLGDPRHTWVHHRAVAQVLRLPPEEGRYRVDDFLLARELLAEGLGVGLLPTFLAQALQREGRLEELSLPELASLTGEMVLLYPSSGQVPRKVAAFRDFLVESSRGSHG